MLTVHGGCDIVMKAWKCISAGNSIGKILIGIVSQILSYEIIRFPRKFGKFHFEALEGLDVFVYFDLAAQPGF